MKYIPVIFALSLGVLYIVIAVPPSVLSKIACVVLGLALLYFGSLATQAVPAPSEEEPGTATSDESRDVAPDAGADRPRE